MKPFANKLEKLRALSFFTTDLCEKKNVNYLLPITPPPQAVLLHGVGLLNF